MMEWEFINLEEILSNKVIQLTKNEIDLIKNIVELYWFEFLQVISNGSMAIYTKISTPIVNQYNLRGISWGKYRWLIIRDNN